MTVWGEKKEAKKEHIVLKSLFSPVIHHKSDSSSIRIFPDDESLLVLTMLLMFDGHDGDDGAFFVWSTTLPSFGFDFFFW